VYSISFNGTDLDKLDGVDVYNYEVNNLPTRRLSLNEIARSDRSVLTNAEYTQKVIRVFMDICNGTRAQTELAYGRVKQAVQGLEGLLVVPQYGLDAVGYTCTLNATGERWEGNKAYITLEFVAGNPFGIDQDVTNYVTSTALTTATATYTPVVTGTAIDQLPIYTINYSALTGGTAKTVTIKTSNARTMNITRDWTASDVLVINCVSQKVTVNQSLVDYTGRFPVVSDGQTIDYEDDLTTRTATIAVTCNERYI
jgi:hypothetical protein